MGTTPRMSPSTTWRRDATGGNNAKDVTIHNLEERRYRWEQRQGCHDQLPGGETLPEGTKPKLSELLPEGTKPKISEMLPVDTTPRT